MSVADAREKMVHHLQHHARMSVLHTTENLYTAAYKRILHADGLLNVS